MSGASLTSRESEILGILEVIYPERTKFALIGGYAVDAYSALPRYSVDCDIVISGANLKSFAQTFGSNGFEDKGPIYRNESNGLATRKFVKLLGNGPVSVEALVGGVRCRQTEAVWRVEEVLQSSREQKVIGVKRSVLSNVASRELLIAMKLHSGRDTDLKDAAMLVDSADWPRVATLADRGIRAKVISQLNNAIEKMKDEKFEEQLRSFFGSKEREKKRVNAAVTGISELLTLLREKTC